ncbi:MAG TPA: ceramidase domain-containing protein [Gemmataceae bacterium]|nr:ceramidase domain-containing protein [Gemmataceae bacterium]
MQTYCERCGPGLFDEPLNAISNVVFLIAAFAVWYLGRDRGVLSPGIWVLIGLSICVGIGSALWHTFASRWALYLDVVPILLFQLCFLWLYGRRIVGLKQVILVLLLLAYVSANLWLRQYRTWLNGVLFYAPTLGFSLSIGVYHYVHALRERYLLLVSAFVFCIALICRTIDLLVCRQLPIGTHFLWHVLNGVVVYCAMRALIFAIRGDRAWVSRSAAP